jgi:hypothetical protein
MGNSYSDYENKPYDATKPWGTDTGSRYCYEPKPKPMPHRHVNVSKCPRCNGTGKAECEAWTRMGCKCCDGTGNVYYASQDGRKYFPFKYIDGKIVPSDYPGRIEWEKENKSIF